MPDIVFGPPPATTQQPQIQFGPPPSVNFGQVAQPERPIRDLAEFPPQRTDFTPTDVGRDITGALREFWNGATLNAWQHIEAGATPRTLPEVVAGRQDFQTQHPVAANLAQGAGAVALMPLAGAASAMTAGASPLARTMLGGAAGAAASGTYGMLAPGEGTIGERAQGALPYAAWGAIAGLAMPAFAAAAPAAGRFLRDAFTPTAGAQRDVRRIASQSPSTIAARMAANPSLTAADIDPQLAHTARELGSPAITNRFAQRQEAVPDMVRQVVAGTIGIRPDIALAQQQLRDTARANLGRVIDPMLATASRVDVNPVLQLMNRTLAPNSPEWRRIDNWLRPQGGIVMTDAESIFQVQSRIRELAESYSQSASPADRALSGDLYRVREQMLTQLDLAAGAVPNTGAGPLRIALSQFRDEMDVDRAFQAGLTNTLYNPTGRQTANIIEQTPEQFQRWRDSLTPDELEAARLGTTAAFQNLMDGTAAGADRAFSTMAIENNRARLAALFGDDAADAMMEGLNIVRGMQGVNTQIAGATGVGSPSAAVRAATSAPDRITGIRAPAAAGVSATVFGGPVAGLATAALTATGQRISSLVRRNAAQRRQAALGRLITTAGAPGQQALANAARAPILPPADMWPVLPFVPQAVEAVGGD